MRISRALQGRRAIRAIFGLTLASALVASVLPVHHAFATGARTSGVPAANASSETGLVSSSDGRIAISVTASPTEVPAGGGEVTFTYTVKNTRKDISAYDLYWLGNQAGAVYFQSTSSNVCNDIQWSGDYRQVSSGEYLLPEGGTATGTCKTTITQDTTNKFEAKVYDYYRKPSSATVDTSVSVKYSGGASELQCEGLWFVSGSPNRTHDSYGVMGVINLNSRYDTEQKFSFKDVVTPSSSFPYERSMNGSAALAVDPKNPDNIYYIPRLRTPEIVGYSPAGLWLYNAKTGKNENVTHHSATPRTARLGAASDGTLWAVAIDGNLHKFDPRTKKWNILGEIRPGAIAGAEYSSQNYTFKQGQSNSLDSGDLAFDGLGNMWLIGSSYQNGKAFLYTIPRDILQSQGPYHATMVGNMGEGHFNGIAFGPDGKLYATTRDDDSKMGRLHIIDKITGTTTAVSNLPYATEDLGSCSLPMPVLRIEKTANLPERETGVTEGGGIKYTVTIENTGNLEATGVTFYDDLGTQNLEYAEGSATLNGEPLTADFRKGPVLVKSKTAKHLGTVGAHEKATIMFETRVKPGQIKVCNTATVKFTGNPERAGTLTDDPSLPGADDPTCTPVYTPAIGLDKKGVDITATGSGGLNPKTTISNKDNRVRYLYFVSVDPNQPKGMNRNSEGFLVENSTGKPEQKRGSEELSHINVSDDQCKDVEQIFREGTQGKVNIGDRNGDGKLQPDETWQYQCTQALPLDKVTTNKATVTASSVQSGKELTDEDTWTVEPGFKIEKNAKVTGANGVVKWKPNGSPVELKKAEDGKLRGTATYRVTVTNVSLIEKSVPAITDDFSTPKGFVLEGLSWVEVDEAGHVGKPTPLGEDKRLPEVPIAPGKSKTYEITAEVSVADATKADWEAARQCKTDKGGEPEFGLFNRVSMPRDADGEENNDACVPVTSPLLTVSVTKLGDNCDTDQRSCELPGASFSLYNADPTSADAKPLADAITVGENAAHFTSKGLIAGTYWLVETAAPNGHVLMAEPVKFELDFDGIKLITTANASVASDDKFNVRVVDQTAGELPQAGGDGPITFILMGLMLVAIGSVGYLRTTGYGPTWGRNRKHSRS